MIRRIIAIFLIATPVVLIGSHYLYRAFAWELLLRAWSSAVASMGTTTLAVTVAVVFALSKSVTTYRKSGLEGLRNDWRAESKRAFLFFAGVWGLLFCGHLLFKIPNEIRAETSKTKPPVHPSAPRPPLGWDRKPASPSSLTTPVPPLHRTDSFTNFIVFNSGNLRSPVVCSRSLMKIGVCSELSDIVKRNLPPTESEWPRFLSTVLQHYFVTLVEYAAIGYGVHSEADGIIFKQIPPIDFPDVQVYEINQACMFVDADRALMPYNLLFVHQIHLPKGTACSLATPTPLTRSLVLERRGYYKLVLSVSVAMKTATGKMPQGFKAPFADTSQVVTYYFRIDSDLTLKRERNAEFVPEDYVEWSRKLLQSFKDKLDLPAEPPDVIYGGPPSSNE